MADSQKVGEGYVEFKVKGLQALKEAVARAGEGMKAAAAELVAGGKAATAAVAPATQAVDGLAAAAAAAAAPFHTLGAAAALAGATATAGLAPAVQAVSAWARGLAAGTLAGQRLGAALGPVGRAAQAAGAALGKVGGAGLSPLAQAAQAAAAPFQRLGSLAAAAGKAVGAGAATAAGAVVGLGVGLAKATGLAGPLAKAGALVAAGWAPLRAEVLALPKAAAEAARGTGQAIGGLGAAIAPVTSVMFGFVRAGFQASASGEVWGYQMEELQRQIASLFVPQIQALIDYTGRLVRWFQSLSGEQQKQIRNWGLALGGITAFAAILPKIIASLSALRVALMGMRIALLALSANPLVLIAAAIAVVLLLCLDWKSLMKDMGGAVNDAGKAGKSVFQELAEVMRDLRKEVQEYLAELDEAIKRRSGIDFKTRERGIGVAALALTAHEEATKAAKAKLQGKKPSLAGELLHDFGLTPLSRRMYRGIAQRQIDDEKTPRKELLPKLRGFEGVDQAFRRIQEAAIKATAGQSGKSEGEQQIDLLQRIYDTVQPLAVAAGNLRPPVR